MPAEPEPEPPVTSDDRVEAAVARWTKLIADTRRDRPAGLGEEGGDGAGGGLTMAPRAPAAPPTAALYRCAKMRRQVWRCNSRHAEHTQLLGLLGTRRRRRRRRSSSQASKHTQQQ